MLLRVVKVMFRGTFQGSILMQNFAGEVLDVRHSGMGLDSKGYLVVDILVDGTIPAFSRQQIISMDPVTEEYVQSGPGNIQVLDKKCLGQSI